MIRTSAVIVPTCKRDKWFSDLAVEGIRKYWPEAFIVEFLDTDRSTEMSVPDDIRKLCREIPYLRKQIDAPFVVDVDDIYILDADCFMFERPTELIDGPYSYQGETLLGNSDYPWGIEIWKGMGHSFPNITPLFCAGLLKAPRTMWTYNREVMYRYLHRCVRAGYHNPDWQYSNVTLDQSLCAGLWRKTCIDNPLPAMEYPLGIPTMTMKIFHACYFRKAAYFGEFVKAYKRRLAE